MRSGITASEKLCRHEYGLQPVMMGRSRQGVQEPESDDLWCQNCTWIGLGYLASGGAHNECSSSNI